MGVRRADRIDIQSPFVFNDIVEGHIQDLRSIDVLFALARCFPLFPLSVFWWHQRPQEDEGVAEGVKVEIAYAKWEIFHTACLSFFQFLFRPGA